MEVVSCLGMCVDDMTIEVEEFLKGKVGENKGCCTPGVCSKYRLGKEAKKKTKSVLGFKEAGTFTEVALALSLSPLVFVTSAAPCLSLTSRKEGKETQKLENGSCVYPCGKSAELIIESLMKSCCNEIDYVKHYRESNNSLEQELENLGELRNDVAGKVQGARDSGQIVDDNVKNWLTSVDNMKIEVEEFLKGLGENKGCCSPGVCSKYRLGKEAKKKTKSVLGLKEKMSSRYVTFTEVSHPPPPPKFESRSFNDYDHFDSREDVFRKIM